jgi:putative FmdB family regulatory protein
MATYAFECRACGERFEVNKPMSEHDHLRQEPPSCPKCGKNDTRQLVTTFSSKPASTV